MRTSRRPDFVASSCQCKMPYSNLYVVISGSREHVRMLCAIAEYTELARYYAVQSVEGTIQDYRLDEGQVRCLFCHEIFVPASVVGPAGPNVAPDLARACRKMSACAYLRENR